MRRSSDPPIVLVKWYDATKWLLERVDSFPKNQRFIFGERLADRALTVLELLVEAAYSRNKQRVLERANREIEVLLTGSADVLVRSLPERGGGGRPRSHQKKHSCRRRGVWTSRAMSYSRMGG